MGRPDLSKQRTAEILDAFERCVAQYGLAGSSLEMVAEQAGVKRSILRHYVGNRNDLVNALAERVVAKYRQQLDTMLSELPKQGRVTKLLDYLFGESSAEDVQSMLVVEALIAAADEYPNCRKLVSEYIEYLVSSISKELMQEYRQSTRSRCWAVAYGLVGLCFNNESLVPLGLPKKYAQASRSCAKQLVATLGDEG